MCVRRRACLDRVGLLRDGRISGYVREVGQARPTRDQGRPLFGPRFGCRELPSGQPIVAWEESDSLWGKDFAFQVERRGTTSNTRIGESESLIWIRGTWKEHPAAVEECRAVWDAAIRPATRTGDRSSPASVHEPAHSNLGAKCPHRLFCRRRPLGELRHASRRRSMDADCCACRRASAATGCARP